MVKRRLHKTKRSGKKRRTTRKMRGGTKPIPPNSNLLARSSAIVNAIAAARSPSRTPLPSHVSSKPSTPPKSTPPVSFSALLTSRVPALATATNRVAQNRNSKFGINRNTQTSCTYSAECEPLQRGNGPKYRCYREITPGSNMYKNSGGTPGICLPPDDPRIQQYTP